MFIFLCRFAPGGLTLRSAGLKKGKKAPGEKLLALPRFPDHAECGKNLANLSNQFAVSPNHRVEFHEHGQLFVGIHNELFGPMERVTAVLLFAGCAPNRRCLHYRYEFVDYCSPVPAMSY
jgi:hypothetical protein